VDTSTPHFLFQFFWCCINCNHPNTNITLNGNRFLEDAQKLKTAFIMSWPIRIWVRMWWNLFWLFQNLANFLPKKGNVSPIFLKFTFAQYFIQEKDSLHQCWEGKCTYTYTHHVELGKITLSNFWHLHTYLAHCVLFLFAVTLPQPHENLSLAR